MTLFYHTYNQKNIREVYRALEEGIFRDATFARDLTVRGDLTVLGTFYMGDASTDNFILKGRFSTMTVAGANVELDSSYTSGELWEIKTKVTSWAGIAGSFKGYYFRAEAGLGNASQVYGLRGMEVFGVSNITSGSDGLQQLSGLYVSAYVKAYAGSYTIPYVYGIEANVGTEALTALTITQAACVYATLQTTSGLADYSKWHGIIVEGGDASSRTYGHAIVVQNPTWSGCATQTWTTGLYINEACTTGISIAGVTTTAFAISGDCTTAISITGGVSAANVISIAATASTAGINISADCTTGITISAQTTAGITISGATADGILISGACSDAIRISGSNSTSAIHITGDQVIGLLYDVDAAANEGIKIMVDDGITVTTGISLARTTTTGICTTGISIDTDGTTGLSIGTGFTGADMIVLAGTGSTSGIRVSGACATAVQVTGSATTAFGILTGTFGTGISLAGTITTGISLAVANGATTTTGISMTCTGTGTITNAISLTYTASATECFAMTVATGQTITTGMSMSGAGTYTTGIALDATALGTGITIGAGTITTGISFTGTFTKGIDFTGATVTVDANRANAFFAIGDYNSNYRSIALTDNFLAVQVNLTNATNPGTSKKLVGYFAQLRTAGNAANARLKGIESYVVVAHTLLDAHAIYGEVYYNASVTGLTNEGLGCGGTVDTTGCSSAPSALLYGGKFRIKGTLNTSGLAHMALFVVSESNTHTAMCIENLATVTNMLWFKSDVSSANGIYMDGTYTDGIELAGTFSGSAINLQALTPCLTNDDNSIIRIGGYDNPLVITGELTDNFFGQSIHIDLREDPDADKWIAPIYLKFTASTESQPHTQAVSCMIRADVQQAIASMYGIQSHIKFTSPGDTATEVIGVSAQLYGTHAGSGLHWGMKSDLRHTGCPTAVNTSACFFGVGTVSCGSGIYIEPLGGTTMAAGVYLHPAGTMTNCIQVADCANTTNLFKFNAVAGCVNAGSVATNTGGSNGHLVIDVGGVGYKIPIFT